MIPSTFPPKEEIARLTARALLEIKAVHFNAETPFTLASGLPSPTYIDCRKLISYPRIRSALMDFLAVTILREAGFEACRRKAPIWPAGAWRRVARIARSSGPDPSSAAELRSALGAIVVILAQDAVAVAFRIVELPVPQRPEERCKTKAAQEQRYRDEVDKHLHRRSPYFSRSAFSVTVSDDVDIASAAMSGVASPTSATGTATTL